MAFTFESFRNLFSGHKTEQVQPTFTPASGRELEQVRDQLLGSALEIKQAWANDLLEGHAPAEVIDTYHQGRLDQINATFDGLRQLAPAITATLNSEEFRAAAYRQAENERDEQARLESYARTEAAEHSASPAALLSQAAFEREEAEMGAREELLHNLEERYAPEPYEESGLSDSEIESRDRIYEMNWRAAQKTALRELQELEQNAVEHGNQPQQLVSAASRANVKSIRPDQAMSKAEAAVSFARNRLAERTSVFEHFEVVRDALRHARGRIGLPEVAAELERQKAAGKFIEVQHIRPNAPAFRYTTPELVAIERETIQIVCDGHGKVAPICLLGEDAITARYTSQANSDRQPDLNSDQIRLIHQTLANRDVIFGIQGRAGTGKTTALNAIRELAEENGYTAYGLGPTSRAVKGLKETGMPAETLQAHLLPKQQPQTDDTLRPRLYFVDETSLASSKQLHSFLQSLAPGDRVLLIGDTKQHQSVEAGRIFEELQDSGLGVARLEKIVRQKDDGLRMVVEAMADGRIADGVQLLKFQHRVEAIDDRHDRFRTIARAFAEAPQSTLVISPDNQSREELNTIIRSLLKEKGQIGNDVFKLGVLKNRQDLTSEDRKAAGSYHVGDSVRYHRGSEALGLGAKSYASVVEVNADENLLTVRRADGKFVTYDPARLSGVAVYQAEVRSFAVGDRVQFLTPWRDKAICTRDTGTIKYLDSDGNARVLLDGSDRVVSWNLNQNRHFDYAYAMTSHSSQGATVDRIIVHIDTSASRLHALINEVLAYVALSRPSYDARVFTDNAEKLERSLSRSNQNTTALSQKSIQETYAVAI